MKPFLRISITILFLLLVGRVFAEQKYFNHLLDGKGLAQNTVQAMYQDSRGFLWIGTQGGVHLFDGQKFTIFQQSLNSVLGLADNYVIDITSDHLGNIWVLSLTGVSKFSFQKMQFEKKIVFGDESEIAFAERLAWSSDGYLILININQIYTFDVNIEKLIEKQEHEFVHHIKKQAGIEFDWFIVDNWLIQNSEDLFKSELPSELAKEALVSLATSIGVLFLSNDSLYLFSKESGWSLLSKKSDFTQIEPVSMTIDLDGFLWIAGKQGKLIQFDIHSKELTIFGQYETRITDPTFTSVIVTQNNFLWVATASSGVFYRNLSGQNFLFLNNQLPGLETMGQNIRDIESNGEALLIGSDDGLSIYDLKRKLISAFFDTTRVLAILKLSQQRALVSTESGLFIVNMTEQSIEMIKQLNAFEVRSMALLNDMVVLGTRAQGVIVIDADSLNIIFQESLAFQKNIARDPMVLELFVDSHSRLWVGHINGLELWDGLLNIQQQSVINKRIIYRDMIIRDVVEVSPEHFFIASHQGLKELRLLHQNEIEFKEYAQSEGLRDSTIYAISVLDDRYVWFSSNSGLGYLDLFTGSIYTFSDDSVLGQLEFNGNSIEQLNGHIYFGGINGITSIDSVSKVDFTIFNAWLKLLRAGNNFSDENHFPNEKITFPPENDTLSFEFVNNYLNPNVKREFRYRINNQPWINLGEVSQIVLAGLQADTYLLQAESRVNNSNWQSIKNPITITIEQVFWKTKWAYLLFTIILSLLFALFWIQEQRRRNLRKLANQKIAESELRMKLALKASDLGLWDWQKHLNKVVRYNTEHLFDASSANNDGFERDDFDYMDQCIHPSDIELLKKERDRFIKEKDDFDVQYRVMGRDGTWHWIHDRGKVMEEDSEGNVIRASGTFSDITQMKRSHLEAVLSNEIIRSMAEAVVVLDKERLVSFVNPAFSRITGYRYQDVIQQKLVSLRSSKHAPQFYDKLWEDLEKMGSWYGELWLKCENGKDIYCNLEAFYIRDEELEEHLTVMVINDISEKRRAEEELNYLARFDSLTKLPNRNLFLDRLEHALALARRHSHNLAVLFIDLDGFKKVNDSYGHQAGDLLLKNVAQSIQSCIRAEDTLARLSGDEFVLIIEEFKDIKDITAVADKVLQKLRMPVKIGPNEVVVTSSIGIAEFPKDAKDSQELIKFADTAMYDAKNKGKNKYSKYAKEMHADLIHRMSIENYLRHALDNNELYLLIQPIVSISSEKVVGGEALIRWRNDTLGEVYPSDFIPLAEETGLIIDIGYFVIERACDFINNIKHKLHRDVYISVNVSVKQIVHENFTKNVENILLKKNVSPEKIRIEITETVLMANIAHTMSVIEQLRSLGFNLSVDDFGTGYSSLNYLKRLEVNELKIDREFTSDIVSVDTEETIVNAIIGLGKSFSMDIVGEGVEDTTQLRYLKQHGCDKVQGFLFSTPLNESDFLEFLTNDNELKIYFQ